MNKVFKTLSVFLSVIIVLLTLCSCSTTTVTTDVKTKVEYRDVLLDDGTSEDIYFEDNSILEDNNSSEDDSNEEVSSDNQDGGSNMIDFNQAYSLAKTNSVQYLKKLAVDAKLENNYKNIFEPCVNAGNAARLKAVMSKAITGESITIVTIGGSITMGAAATTPEKRYANRVVDWFRAIAPDTKINFVNAGIAATSSAYGMLRVQEDVLKYNPDFVLFEYAVNDAGNGEYLTKTYEGLLKQLLEFKKDLAVMTLFMSVQGGGTAQNFERPVAEHYNIARVSTVDAFADLPDYDDIFSDGTHPTDLGHARVALGVDYLLDKILVDLNTSESSYVIPAVFDKDVSNFTNTYLLRFEQNGQVLNNITSKLVDGELQNLNLQTKLIKNNTSYEYKGEFSDGFRDYYVIKVPEGETFKFQINDIRSFFIVMNRDTNGGEAEVSVNGEVYNCICNYRASHLWDTEPLYFSPDGKPHSVSVEIYAKQGDFNIAAIGICD